jgi:hypothetical protein
MAVYAAVREQARRRFAFVDILSLRRGAGQRIKRSKDEQGADEFGPRQKYR